MAAGEQSRPAAGVSRRAPRLPRRRRSWRWWRWRSCSTSSCAPTSSTGRTWRWQNARHVVDVEKAPGHLPRARLAAGDPGQPPAGALLQLRLLLARLPADRRRWALLMYFRRRRAVHLHARRHPVLGRAGAGLLRLFPVAPPRLVPRPGIIDTLQALQQPQLPGAIDLVLRQPVRGDAEPARRLGGAAGDRRGAGVRPRQPAGAAAGRRCTRWRSASSTVVTGNHYFLDGAGGLVAAAAGLCFAVFDAALGLPTCAGSRALTIRRRCSWGTLGS